MPLRRIAHSAPGRTHGAGAGFDLEQGQAPSEGWLPQRPASPETDTVKDEVEATLERGLQVVQSVVKPHQRALLQECGVEMLRILVVGAIAALFLFRSSNSKQSESGGMNQFAAVFLIAPLFTATLAGSLAIIARKVSLLAFPVMVTPGIKRSAKYRAEFEEKRATFTPSMQEFLEANISRFTSYLENFNSEVKELATAIEEALRLPMRPKRLEMHNPAVRDLLRHYPSAVKREIAETVAAICHHSLLDAPEKRTTPTMLLGPPGTGKTFLVRQLARALKLPLCEVKLSDFKLINGNNLWSNDPEMGVILTALLRASLEERENPPANVILFIDEVDKMVDHPETAHAMLAFLHTLLEAGTVEVPLPRYFNATCSIRHLIVILGVNRRFSEILSANRAEALETRIRTIDFGEGYSKEKKSAIVQQHIDGTPVHPDDPVIKRILAKDEELHLKGVRILLDVVDQYLQSHAHEEAIAFLSGEKSKPFDVEGAYARYFPKEEEDSAAPKSPTLFIHV